MLLLFTPAAPTQHALTPPSTSTDPGTARMAAAARADALRTTVYSGGPGNSTPAGYMPETYLSCKQNRRRGSGAAEA